MMVILYSYVYSVLLLLLGKGIIYYLAQIGPILVLCFLFVKLRRIDGCNQCDTDISIVIKIYIAWNICIFFLGLFDEFSLQSIARVFLYPQEGLFYLTPLFSIMVVTQDKICSMYKWWIINIIISIIATISFRDIILVANLNEIRETAEDSNGMSFYNYLNLASLIPSAVLSCAYFFISTQWKNNVHKCFIIIAIILALIAPALLGRRGAIAFVLLFVTFIFVLKFKYKKYWLLIIFIIIFCAFEFIDNYQKTLEDAFPILSNRLTDDTRSWAEDEFFKDFQGDWWSYIFGRGAKGTYYSPTFGHRGIIETGYLNMILHGGLISVSLYVVILVTSFIRGYFYSRNLLINAMALYLLGQILLLYPGSPIGFSIDHLSTWIAIMCCCTYEIRNSEFKISCF